MAMDKEARTVMLAYTVHLLMHDTPSCEYLLLTREHCYVAYLYVYLSKLGW